MTNGFAPRLKLAVKSQAKRAEKRQLTPRSRNPSQFIKLCSRATRPQSSKNPKTLIERYFSNLYFSRHWRCRRLGRHGKLWHR